jgi:hypothetical protein
MYWYSYITFHWSHILENDLFHNNGTTFKFLSACARREFHWRCVTSPTSMRRLGAVVVSVLDTGPKDRGFEPGQDYGFLRVIKIRSTPSFKWEVKAEGLMSYPRFYGMWKISWIPTATDGQTKFSFPLPICYSLQRCLCWQDQSILSHLCPHRSHPGMNNRPVDAAVLRRQSRPITTKLTTNPSECCLVPHRT